MPLSWVSETLQFREIYSAEMCGNPDALAGWVSITKSPPVVNVTGRDADVSLATA